MWESSVYPFKKVSLYFHRMAAVRVFCTVLQSWLLENLCIWVPAILSLACVTPPPVDATFLDIWFFFLQTGFIIVEGNFLCQHVLLNTVYRDAPSLSVRCSDAPVVQQGVFDFFTTMVPAQFIASAGFSFISFMLLPRESVEATLRLTAEHGYMARPLPFLLRLLIVRVTVDIWFYIVHWLLHRKGVYEAIHITHHEHIKPTLWTNYHFSVLDLIFEGFVPFGIALAVLESIGLSSPLIETNALLAHIMHYEIGSHSGTTAPLVSFFPPLSCAYKLFLGDIDRENVLFHHCHHVYRLCNYGITQWVDILLGTKKQNVDMTRHLYRPKSK